MLRDFFVACIFKTIVITLETCSQNIVKNLSYLRDRQTNFEHTLLLALDWHSICDKNSATIHFTYIYISTTA